MRFKISTPVYDKLWENGGSANVFDLTGLHNVEVCSGLLPNFRKWRKKIMAVTGFNIKGRRNKTFGDFKVTTAYREDGIMMQRLGYNDSKIVDYLVKITPSLHLGKFTWRGKFLGYFWLCKIEEIAEIKGIDRTPNDWWKSFAEDSNEQRKT